MVQQGESENHFDINNSITNLICLSLFSLFLSSVHHSICMHQTNHTQTHILADTPTCATDNELFFEAQLFEELTVSCAVKAEPSDVLFFWEFNSTLPTAGDSANLRKEPLMAITNAGLRSELKFTPRSPQEYGTLYCYAQNRIGQQRKPCVFHITKSGESKRRRCDKQQKCEKYSQSRGLVISRR